MKRAAQLFPDRLPRPYRHIAAAAFAWLALGLSSTAGANTFAVNTSTDGAQDPTNTTTCAEVDASNVPTGKCSLRAAIKVGNGITGPHTINVAVPTIKITNGSGWDMRAPFILNGNNVTIDGNGLACLILDDAGTEDPVKNIHNGNGATNSTITNINIGNCSGNAIGANGHGYSFLNNHIGLDASGLIAMPNTGSGVSLSASAAYGSQFIDVAGLKTFYDSLPAQPVDSIEINNFSVNIATALQNLNPNTISGNVISNNAVDGIDIFSQNLAATIIKNNFIGTNPTGTIAMPNGNGIALEGSTFSNLIGPGNVISGNTQNGIKVAAGAVFLPNYIMGNVIGLPTADGTHIGNGQSGIFIDSSPDTSAGHFNPSSTALIVGPLNTVGDNQGSNNNPLFPDQLGSAYAGVVITGSSTGVKVLGNRIGLAQFTPALLGSYGNKGDGIIVTTSGNKIGGSGATDGNTIAANGRHGIVVSGSATQSNSILGNTIGGDPQLPGNLTLGNAVDGIHIDAANSTTIGGTGTTDFNTIVGNGRNGIKIRNGSLSNGWSNASQRNLIYHNATAVPLSPGHAGVGIDLDDVEDAANPVHDEFIGLSYANFDQAQPVVCAGPADTGKCAGSVAPGSSGGTTTLQWTIKTHGPANFRVEFFRIDTTDDNTATKMSFLGEHSISTDLSGYPADSAECGSGRCTTSLAASSGGAYIVATATDVTPLTNTAGNPGDWKAGLKCFFGDLGIILDACPVNNTSEFSAVATIPAAAPSVVTNAATGITTVAATLQGTVSANGANASVSFEYGPTTAYGSPGTATPATVTASQNAIAVSAGISGLTCATTYHYRANATNSQGTTQGNDQTFTTAPCAAGAPSATTVAASAIAATGATLNGLVTANGQTTTVQFKYGNAPATYNGVGSPAAASQSPLSSGASSAAVTLALSGLTCNTTYYYRVTANNGIGGTIQGSELSFKTAVCAAVAPTVATGAASSIAATTATLNGTASANGAITTVTFDFGLTTTYGALGSPASAAQSPLSSGANNTAVTAAITGLSCNTLYHFRANANNGIGGTINGADQTFTTGACVQAPPSAITFAATLSANSATLNGQVSANGAATTVTFDYGPTTAYGTNVAATPATLATNATAVSYVLATTCATTYHFRVSATNSGGTTTGADQSFTTTACAPTATTNPATALTATGATLNGTVSANGASTTVMFEYGTTNAYGSSIAATPSPVSTNGTAVSAAVTGLTCGTTYHFRVDANNGSPGGTVTGADLTFTPPCASPVATTGIASAITQTGASLAGTVSANGAATTVSFEYGTTVSYGSTVAATQSPLAAGSPANAPVSVTIAGLTCGTLYHFRVDANNGTAANGSDATFTTSACPAGAPSATTGAASAITQTSAALAGTVSANGSVTTVSFEYGTTVSYGSSAVAIESPLASGSPANAPVSATIGGLSCGTLYHFRVDANNGTAANGSDATFTTSACPAGAPSATTGVASAITQTGASLAGTVSANGAATTVSFEYGTTVSYGSTAVAIESPLASGSPANAPVSATIGGLSCGTLYHFRVDANNGTAANGSDATFTTSACPAGAPGDATGVATLIGANGATLNGTVSANGAATLVSFDYGTTAAYGSNAVATQSPLAAGSAANTPVSAPVAGLACATQYHFRIRANNGNGGDVLGADAVFTTSACASITTYSGPTVTGTGTATAVLSGGGATCSLSNPAFVGAPVPAPAGVTFPDGLFQFSAINCVGTITVTVTFPTLFSAGEQYYKYGPTPGPVAAHWYALGGGNNLSLIGNVATFTIADGGLGDDDLAVNGTIVDQGGPGAPAPAAGGAAVPAPALDLRALLALIALLALFGMRKTRGARRD